MTDTAIPAEDIRPEETEGTETEVQTEVVADTQDEPVVEPTEEELAKRRKHEKTQRRINKLTREKKEAQAEAHKLKEQLAGYTKTVEPKTDDFEDYNDYINAKVDYEVKQRTQSSEAVTSQPSSDITHMLQSGAEKYSDFDAVVRNPELTMLSLEVIDDITIAENSDDILYHLAKNPVELERIALLDSRERAHEIGRLEVSLNKPKPRTTQTPPPIKPLDDASSQPVDVSKMSMDEYAQYRNKTRWSQGKP